MLAYSVALFIACSLADPLLTAVGMRLGLFPVNPVFRLLLFRGVPLGAALWIGLTLVRAANRVIAYPDVPKWARREAIIFCTIMAALLAMDGWSLLQLAIR